MVLVASTEEPVSSRLSRPAAAAWKTPFTTCPEKAPIAVNCGAEPPAHASRCGAGARGCCTPVGCGPSAQRAANTASASGIRERRTRSEEHTSELQSRPHLVCRLLLEKKKKCIEHITEAHELVQTA